MEDKIPYLYLLDRPHAPPDPWDEDRPPLTLPDALHLIDRQYRTIIRLKKRLAFAEKTVAACLKLLSQPAPAAPADRNAPITSAAFGRIINFNKRS